MTGWKTKTGATMVAVGGFLVASGKAFPIPKYTPWLEWIGGLILAVGGALGIYGVGAKVEKAANGKPS